MVTVQVGRDITIYYATGAKYGSLYRHKFASGSAIGFANLLSYTVEENVEGYKGVGRRIPYIMKPGAKETTIHLEGLWVDSGAMQLFLNQAEISGNVISFAMGASGTDRGVGMSGCRLTTTNIEFNAEGWATAKVDIPCILID